MIPKMPPMPPKRTEEKEKIPACQKEGRRLPTVEPTKAAR